MNTVWLPLSVVLGIAAFYVFLALGLLCRLFGGRILDNLRSRRRSSSQPPLPAWMPPSEALDRHKNSTIQA